MLNQVLKVSSRTFQQSVEVLLKSVTFLDFRLSQGSVAIYCRWGGNLCDVYIKNFLTNHLVKLEIGLHLQNWHGISKCTVFIGPPCTIPAITTNLQNQHKTAWNDAFQIQTEIYHSHRMRQLCHIFSLCYARSALLFGRQGSMLTSTSPADFGGPLMSCSVVDVRPSSLTSARQSCTTSSMTS